MAIISRLRYKSIVNKNGLALNISMDNNVLDFDLAKEAGLYFRQNEKEMNAIIDEVKSAVSG